MNSDSKYVAVDNALLYLCREGVQFMFECVAGLRGMEISKNENTTSGGCILADDMGYAKPLILHDVGVPNVFRCFLFK